MKYVANCGAAGPVNRGLLERRVTATITFPRSGSAAAVPACLSELPDLIKIQAATMAITGHNGVYFDASGRLRTKAWFVGSRTYVQSSRLV
jgi:hypothetical protein